MGSFKLLSIRGIDIRVHITFPLILIWSAVQHGVLNQAGFSLSGAAFGVVVTILLFICVVIHELSHSLISKRMGFVVRDIILLPTGGASQIEELPEGPGKELLMAIAGPLSNFVVAIVLVVIGLFTPTSAFAGLRRMAIDPMSLSWQDTLPYLIFANVALGAFNLIPVLPMDGGRVLRALLAIVMTRGRATKIAVRISQGFAGLFGLGGLLTGNLFWILLALSFYSGAVQEGRMTQIRGILEGVKVGQVFSRDVQAVSPDDLVSHAADLTLESSQVDFPVCDEGEIVGLLTHTAIVRALRMQEPDTPVRDVMTTDVPMLRANDGLFQAYQQIRSSGLNALPVIEAGEVAGLLIDAYEFMSIKEILKDKLRGI
jgi:Zn-dependent protease/CBS domain-containing protein